MSFWMWHRTNSMSCFEENAIGVEEEKVGGDPRTMDWQLDVA